MIKYKRPQIETLTAVVTSGGELVDAHFEVLEVCEYALELETRLAKFSPANLEFTIGATLLLFPVASLIIYLLLSAAGMEVQFLW